MHMAPSMAWSIQLLYIGHVTCHAGPSVRPSRIQARDSMERSISVRTFLLDVGVTARCANFPFKRSKVKVTLQRTSKTSREWRV